MKLIEGAGQVWSRLWSVKLALAAALLSAIDAGVQYYLTGNPPIMSILGAFLSAGAAVARIIAQPKLYEL